MRSTIATALVLLMTSASQGGVIRVTEWMYSGNVSEEFIEICNVGVTPENLTGWSYSDSARIPGHVSLSAFGVMDPGECAIITEASAGAFNSSWSLGGTVAILGNNVVNLGRIDEINIYDAGLSLVDRLTYGDNDPNFPGSIRTQNFSGWVSQAGLGINDVYEWTLSSIGDFQNSWESANENVGNPGSYVVPEPATLALLAMSLVAFRRRSK